MRKEFEKLPEIAAELENSDGELYWCDKQNQYRNNRVFQDSQTGWMNGAWYAWQAKAQAVPEGFVLVPKEMPKSFDEGLYVYSNSISIVDECSEGFIPMSDINHAEVWKLVIEAQEQNQ